jgi:Flp pilus assembly protein TadG
MKSSQKSKSRSQFLSERVRSRQTQVDATARIGDLPQKSMGHPNSGIAGNKRARPIGTLTLRAALADNFGGALVDLAAIIPIFSLLLIGMFEFGRLAYFSIEVSNAARAGAAYAAQSDATSTYTAGIQTAAQNDAPNLTNITTLTVTPTTVCQCDNSGTFTTMTSCTATCSSPGRVITYAQVNTSASVGGVISLPQFPISYTLTGQAIMRVNQQ